MVEQEYDTTIRDAFVQSAISEIDLNGRITYVNKKFSEVSRYSEEELVGKEYDALKFWNGPSQLFAVIRQRINAGKIFSGILKERRNDGNYNWFDATIIPVKNKEGKVIKYVDARYPITSVAMAEFLYKKQAEKLGLSET